MAGTNKQELIRSKRVINETFEEPRVFSGVEWRDHLVLSEKIGALDTKFAERLSSAEARLAALEHSSNHRSTTKVATFTAMIGFGGAVIGAALAPFITEWLK